MYEGCGVRVEEFTVSLEFYVRWHDKPYISRRQRNVIYKRQKVKPTLYRPSTKSSNVQQKNTQDTLEIRKNDRRHKERHTEEKM